MSLSDLMVAVLEGLAAGAVPGLLAAGLALVHRTTGVLSFAHGALGAAGAYAAYAAGGDERVLTGAFAACATGALLGAPLAGVGRIAASGDRGAPILATLGYGLLLETGIRALFGSDVKAFLHAFAEEVPLSLPWGGSVARSSLFMLVGVFSGGGVAAYLLSRTRLGLALFAVGSDRAAAASLGLPIGRLEVLAWSLSGSAAGISGWLLAPRLGLEPNLMWAPMVAGFVAAALGGLDHPGRALLAGLGLGLGERALYEATGPQLAPTLRWALYGLVLAVVGRRRA